jgi:hypothetical protein
MAPIILLLAEAIFSLSSPAIIHWMAPTIKMKKAMIMAMMRRIDQTLGKN